MAPRTIAGQVLRLVERGLSSPEIATRLNVTMDQVEIILSEPENWGGPLWTIAVGEDGQSERHLDQPGN